MTLKSQEAFTALLLLLQQTPMASIKKITMKLHSFARNSHLVLKAICIALLPSGIVIAADCTPNPTGVNSTVTGGCSLLAGTEFSVSQGSTLTATNTITVRNSLTGVNAPSLLNNGTITSVNTPGNGSMAVYNSGTLTSLINNGVISAPAYYVLYNQGTITSLLNTGSMTGPNGISNYGTISTLTNTGTLSPINGDDMGMGGITTLTNLQGEGNAAGALQVRYQLPLAYNLIAYSPSSYGQLSASNIFSPGTLAFNVYGNTGTTLVNGVAESVLSSGTYADVLQGFSNLSNVSGISGTYGNYTYALIAGAQVGSWDLQVTSLSTNILNSNIYLTSNLGASVNPVFSGGTLRVSAAGLIASAFSIQANNATIDQNGLSSNFTGNITEPGGPTHGRLIIVNSGAADQGSVTLSGFNTYTGGTEVQSGATLSINSANALGSGGLTLVGSTTVPATLETTQTMTISNPITVAYDPVFNVASGTVLTLSSSIADGVAPGDVVKTGAGNLALTAANTYTGPTIITAGTLTLNGAGSIAQSSSVTNNATFDVATVPGNVTLGGTYSQGSTGTLKMSVAPASHQQINVTGAANLGGALDLMASEGAYRPGRYTLMTSAGLGGSRFSSLSANLASITNYNYSLAYDANNVFLELRSTAADTLSSIQATAPELNRIYNEQYSIAVLGQTYDCKLFDNNNLCLSTGVRVTQSRADGSTYGGVALIAGYRVHSHVRLGGWIDQNESRNTAMNVTAGNSTPMFGAFAIWNESLDSGKGLEVKVSAAYGKKDLRIDRPVVGTSERGRGYSEMFTLVAEAMLSYGINLDQRSSLQPYAGLRYANLSNRGYVEDSDVFSPLTFAKTSQSANSLIVGIKLYDKPEGPIGLELNLGVERFVRTSSALLSAGGLDGLSAVQMSPVISKNRPYVSASLRHDIGKNQHLLFGLSHSKEFANSDWVNSATVRYVTAL